MKVRAITLALPALVLASACMHTSKQSSAGTASSGQPEPQQPQASGGAVTQDPMMVPGPAVQGHAEDQVVAGQISDVTEDTLSIRTELGDTRTLQIVPETAIQLDGSDASTDELAEGQPVRASFDVVNGQEIAVKVQAGEESAAQGGTASGQAGSGTDQGASPIDQGGSPPDQGTPGNPGGSTGSGAGSSGSGAAAPPGGTGGAGPSGGGQGW